MFCTTLEWLYHRIEQIWFMLPLLKYAFGFAYCAIVLLYLDFLHISLYKKNTKHISLDWEVCVHKISLTLQLFIVVPVISQEGERSSIWLSGVSILSLFLRFCDWSLERFRQCGMFCFTFYPFIMWKKSLKIPRGNQNPYID